MHACLPTYPTYLFLYIIFVGNWSGNVKRTIQVPLCLYD